MINKGKTITNCLQNVYKMFIICLSLAKCWQLVNKMFEILQFVYKVLYKDVAMSYN